MPKASTTFAPNPYPTSTSFSSLKYWKSTIILDWIGGFFAIALCLFVLIATCFGKSHFMKSFSAAIFIPLFLNELLSLYQRLITFSASFSASEREANAFNKKYLLGSGWQDIAWEYIHYNTLFFVNAIITYSARAVGGRNFSIRFINLICLVGQGFVLLILLMKALNLMDDSIPTTASDQFDKVYPQVLSILLIFSIPIDGIWAAIGGLQNVVQRSPEVKRQALWAAAYGIVPFITFIPTLILDFSTCFQQNESTNLSFVISIEYVARYLRPIYMAVITISLLPPYRQLIFKRFYASDGDVKK